MEDNKLYSMINIAKDNLLGNIPEYLKLSRRRMLVRDMVDSGVLAGIPQYKVGQYIAFLGSDLKKLKKELKNNK